MKKLLVVMVVLAVALIAGSAMATVVDTLHDMTTISSQVGATPGTSEVCVYCHTPHGANTSDYPNAPLWNKENVTGASNYQPYSSTATGSIQGTISTTVTGVTKACLSCHDGSLAVYSMVNVPNSGGYVNSMTGPSGNLTVEGKMTGSPLLGWDFRNDHPVGITYRPDLDSGLADVPGSGLPLYGTGTSATVECGSCHDVHNDTYEPFLRISNAVSALCIACHENK